MNEVTNTSFDNHILNAYECSSSIDSSSFVEEEEDSPEQRRKKPTTTKQNNSKVLEGWSVSNLTSQQNDLHASVPLDIALLHIETDVLLESLRNSAITPKEGEQISPSATASTTEMSRLLDSPLNVSPLSNTLETRDDHSDISIDDSDDGMGREMRQLDQLTFWAEESSLNASNEDGNLIQIQDEDVEDSTFNLFIRDVLLLTEDLLRLVIKYSGERIERASRTKIGASLIQKIITRPWHTVRILYAFVCIMKLLAFIFLK
ncbi:predicted protein [Chaetoceros tenuissimus]|uniref:Uncharacterized protein n=1 Tax=Chaetoceros tenuissimus TaxID=426638 RepID=A0AAD3D7R2_9STRA|nr:predicted protein [Chaetoceros tenuissimus]